MTLPRETKLRYMPAVDALRAVAVLAVFFYHAGVSWMPGGFLGVDVFFVISGYLITALLVSEFRRAGHINVAAFWLRRARRLLPAVAVMIALTLLVALFLVPAKIGELRGDALASLLYVNNWHLILTDQSYFEQFAQPSLFRHLWSLSVEEQFYLLWPLFCAGGLARLGHRRLLLATIAGIVASTLLMAALFDPTSNELLRAFYGTDTRAAALFVGVALALVWHPSELPFAADRRVGWALDGIGLLGLVMVLRTFFVATDFDPALYRGGFLLLAIWSAMLIASLAHPAANLSRLLAVGPAVWLGVRSYGFYLWHWPVVTLSRPDIDVPLHGPLLIGLQLAATLLLADLSYRFVEQPFRKRARAPSAPDWLRVGRPALAAGVLAVIVIVGWGGLASGRDGGTASSRSPAPPAVKAPDPAAVPAHLNPYFEQQQGQDTSRSGPAGNQGDGGEDVEVPPVLAIGDSVMVGARAELVGQLGGEVTVDAVESRQPTEYPGVIDAYRAAGELPENVVVQIGNNGPVYSTEIEQLKTELAGVPHVYLVNVEVPRSWEREVNEELSSAVADWPEAELVDWQAAIGDHPDLTYDGIHPTPEGEALYADTIAAAVRSGK